MALVAACTRESRCTTSRIHQRIQKNSFPLKEVLTGQSVSARSDDAGDIATCSRLDAKIAATTRIGVRQYCRNRFYCSAFLNSRTDDRCTISVVATQQFREKAVRTDSESQSLATKKFSWSQRWSLADARQNELFRTNRDHRFGRALAVATASFGSRRAIDACTRASIATSPTLRACPVTGRFQMPSFAFRRSLTACGLALPPDCFIT